VHSNLTHVILLCAENNEIMAMDWISWIYDACLAGSRGITDVLILHLFLQMNEWVNLLKMRWIIRSQALYGNSFISRFFLISQAPILKDPSWFASQKFLSLKSLVVRAFPEFSIVHEVHSFLRHPHVCARSPIIQLRVRTELLDYKWIVYLSLSV
jgi:hypothetical protein